MGDLPPGKGQRDSMHRLVAGYATIGQGAGPMIVTARAGLFAKYGLEVETRLMQGAKGVVRGLGAGEIQFGNLAAPALLRSVLTEGSDLVFLTGGINQQFLVTRSGIKSRKQLTGGRLGFVGDGGLNDVLVHFIIEKLQSEGIEGLQLVPLAGSGKQSIAQLMSGHCDAAVLTPPEAIYAKREGCNFLIDFAEYGLNYALGGIASSRHYIENNTEVTRKFIQAYVEGMHRYRADRAFTVQAQQEYSGIPDRTIAEETYDLTRPGMPQTPYPVLNALKTALQVIARDLAAAATVDPQRFVDTRFIKELQESGFIKSLEEGT